MQRTFAFDARQLLASDLLIASDQPLLEQFTQEAQKRNLHVANTVVFPSMATVGSQSKLASLKAVSPQYPLRGALKVQSSSLAITSNNLPSGSVWVDAAMLASLNAQVGNSISLGSGQFTIAGVLTQELDRGAGFMNFAPRVMMSLDDLASTGLLGLGSRVTYRLLLAGEDANIQSYEKWATGFIESEKLRGLRVETLENAQPIMRKTLERAERFLSLIALLTAMVSAVAIALSARRYVLKQADSCAVLKCFGSSSLDILKRQLQTLICLGIIAAIVGSAIGYLVQHVLLLLLGNLVIANLQSASIWPVVWSAALSWFLLIGFALPPLLGLVKVSPVRLIRKEYARLPGSAIWGALFGLSVCLALIGMAARDWKLALWTAGSFGGAIALFGFISWMALWLLGKIRSHHFVIRFVLIVQSRSVAYAIVQITALGIAIMALLMIILLRQDLLSAWQGNIPSDAPNRFMINVQEDQKQGIEGVLTSAGVAKPEFYPMVRGRLVAVNGREVRPADYPGERARRLVDREFNLSYTDQLPAHNPLLAGQWVAGQRDGVSVEQGIADTLGLKLGDRLRFDMGGIVHEARITSMRKVDWASMRANFFMLFPLAEMPDLPTTWLAAFRTPESDRQFERVLVQKFPNVTSVDMRASLMQVQRVLDQVIQAVEFLFAFTLAAGVMVLLAAIGAGRQAREREYAIMRALGAGRALLGQVQRAELLGVGFLAGFMASAMALAVGWALARYAFDFAWTPLWWAPLAGGCTGAVLAWAAGSLSLAGVLRQPVVQTLRQATD